MADTHQIQRQLLDLHFAKEATWKQAEPLVNDLQRQDIPRVLEDVFAQLALKQEDVLAIPRLEIDLGALALSELDTQFAARLQTRLSKELTRQLTQLQAKPRKAATAAQDQHEDMAMLTTVQARAQEQLCYFLQRGHLPWGVSPLESQTQLEALVDQLTPSKSEAHSFLRRPLRDLLQQVPDARHRFNDQLPAVWVREVVQLWYTDASTTLYQRLHKLWQTAWPKESLATHEIPWTLLVSKLSTSALRAATALLVDILLQAESAVPASVWEQLWQLFRLPKFPVDVTQQATSRPTTTPQKEDEKKHLQPPQIQPDEQVAEVSGKQIPSFDPASDLPVEEVVYIGNAGLVILHPYLPIILRQFGWLEADQFVDSESQNKALVLLHYLAFGALDSALEVYYPLNKLLCGLEVTVPVWGETSLTKAHCEEADRLLDAVVTNWSILGNSSREALQEGFLQREGNLLANTDQWTLEVERKSIDVLLDHLPWGLAWIKYPWMTKPLLVNWT